MNETAPRSGRDLTDSLPPGLSGAGGEALDLDGPLTSAEPDQPVEPPLPYEDGRFELIFSLEGFSWLRASREAWLAEIERLLTEGGLFIAALPSAGARGNPDEGREWAALRKREEAGGRRLAEDTATGGALATLLAELDSGRRREIDRLRESFHRELMRKSLRIAELEPDTTTTPATWAIAERVASAYEETLSWRLTGPVRAAKRALARR